MPQGDVKSAATLFKMLGDETRVRILASLLDGEKCVCEIVPVVKRSQPTVSIHLSKLEAAGIVASRQEGRMRYYRIADSRVEKILRDLGFE